MSAKQKDVGSSLTLDQISQRVPLLHFLSLCDLPETFKKIQKKSVNFFDFFHYFDIVRLLLDKKNFRKGSAFIFLEFCGRMDVENTKRPPFQFFSELWDFFSFFFHQRVTPSIFLMICDRRD